MLGKAMKHIGLSKLKTYIFGYLAKIVQDYAT
jgi:hypothetical protein